MSEHEQEVLITLEGLQQKKDELENLKTVRRREVAARIKQAIEFGDISENSEYEDAKNEQAFIEGEILNLEKLLKNARIIDEEAHSNSVISEYSTVELKNMATGAKIKFQIVGSVDAKPFEQKISNESPVGAAVLGHKKGDVVEVNAPAGIVTYRVMSISK